VVGFFTLHTKTSGVQLTSFIAKRTDRYAFLFDFTGTISQRDVGILTLFTLAVRGQSEE
jgi:hypothetical protein